MNSLRPRLAYHDAVFGRTNSLIGMLLCALSEMAVRRLVDGSILLLVGLVLVIALAPQLDTAGYSSGHRNITTNHGRTM